MKTIPCCRAAWPIVSRRHCFSLQSRYPPPFTVAALGILLGTIASTMGQFGLLVMPVLLVMQLSSGSATPLESMPVWLQYLMQAVSPTPHFVLFAQGVLYRGAGVAAVWLPVAAMAVIGSVYFAYALHRFRRVIFDA